MERVKVVQQVDISWGITYAPSVFNWSLSIIGGTTFTIVSNDGYDFVKEGFWAGDVVDIGVNISGIPFAVTNCTVSFVDGNTMVITLSIPYVLPAGIIGIRIEAKSPLTGLNYKFGLIDNNENFNTISKVSGNDQGYYSGSIGLGSPRDTSFQTMTPLGSYRDWITGSARARYVSNPDTYVQRFEIEHEFLVVPYYLEGELTNLQNYVLPTLYKGANTLKYVYNAGFRTVLTQRSRFTRIDESHGITQVDFVG